MGVPDRLLVVCDGDAGAGFGHVNRCLAVGEIVSDRGWEVEFLGGFSPETTEMIGDCGFAITVPPPGAADAGFPQLLRSKAAAGEISTLLLDSYRVDAEDVSAIARALGGRRLVIFDDDGRLHSYPCDAVLNFTAGAGRLSYPEGGGERFLGSAYFPARRWLRKLRDERLRAPGLVGGGEKVLITVGGNDREGVTRELTQAACESPSVSEVVVVIREGHPDSPEIDAFLSRLRGRGRRIPPLASLAGPFRAATAVLCGGGLTKYESMFLGLPTAVVNFSELQAEDTHCFASAGALLDLGDASSLDGERVREAVADLFADAGRKEALSRNASEQFPEGGAEDLFAIVAAPRGKSAADPMTVRPEPRGPRVDEELRTSGIVEL